MPSPAYERNKENILRWRLNHKDEYMEISRRDSKRYYDAHAAEIRAKKKARYHEKKALEKEKEQDPVISLWVLDF